MSKFLYVIGRFWRRFANSHTRVFVWAALVENFPNIMFTFLVCWLIYILSFCQHSMLSVVREISVFIIEMVVTHREFN